MEEKKAKRKIIYSTENFIVYVPNKPHISREDGGNLRIRSKEKYYAI